MHTVATHARLLPDPVNNNQGGWVGIPCTCADAVPVGSSLSSSSDGSTSSQSPPTRSLQASGELLVQVIDGGSMAMHYLSLLDILKPSTHYCLPDEYDDLLMA